MSGNKKRFTYPCHYDGSCKHVPWKWLRISIVQTGWVNMIMTIACCCTIYSCINVHCLGDTFYYVMNYWFISFKGNLKIWFYIAVKLLNIECQWCWKKTKQGWNSQALVKAIVVLVDLTKFLSIFQKPPSNQFKRQINVQQNMATRGSYVHNSMVEFGGGGASQKC